MELATPDSSDFFAFMNEFSYNTTFNIFKVLKEKRQNLSGILNGYGFRAPIDKLRIRAQHLDSVVYKIQHNIESKLSKEKNRTALLSSSLEANNFRKILKKGFVIVRQDSKIIKRGVEFASGESASLEFYDKEITVNENNG
jgi:exonuclease VII large subunit